MFQSIHLFGTPQQYIAVLCKPDISLGLLLILQAQLCMLKGVEEVAPATGGIGRLVRSYNSIDTTCDGGTSITPLHHHS